MAQGNMASQGVLAPEGTFVQNSLNEDGLARHARVSLGDVSAPFWLCRVIEGMKTRFGQ